MKTKPYLIHGGILALALVLAILATTIVAGQRSTAAAEYTAAQQNAQELTQKLDTRATELRQQLDGAGQELAAAKQKLETVRHDIKEDSFRVAQKRKLYNETEQKRSAKQAEIKTAEQDVIAAQKRYDEAVAAKAKADAEKARAAEEARKAAEEKKRQAAEAKKKNSSTAKKNSRKSKRK